MTLLADALEAIYRSRESFRSVRAAGVARRATHRLWFVRPGHLRAERDTDDGIWTLVHVGEDWWVFDPEQGALTGNDRQVHFGDQGGLTHLLDPTPLLGLARLEARDEVRVLGRPAVRLHAEARLEDVFEPGWHFGAGGMDLAIDLERGIALEAGETRLTDVAFDGEVSPETFVLELPAGTQPTEARARPQELSLADATTLVSFPVVLPRWLPEGARLVRCVIPGEGPPDGLHLEYVVDPGAVHSIGVSQGPRVTAEEPTAWSDWREETRDGVELRVRQDSWSTGERAMVLLERHSTGAMVSSDLPLDDVVRIALSLEPTR